MSSFSQRCQEVAEAFLHTAVVVDDRAVFEHPANQPTQLTKPGRRGRTETESNTNHSSTEDIAHLLNAGQTIEHFAEKGIVCSVLKPDQTNRETIWETVSRLGQCSDIVVLDWSIDKDGGKKIREVIRDIAEKQAKQPERLLLMAIYTGEADLAKIAEKIGNTLEDAGIGFTQDGSWSFSLNNSLRIVIFAKPKTKTPDKEQIIPFEALAGRLTEEYAHMTKGLISNLALASLAQIRKNTHKVLARFSADLDPAYLHHRILLGQPEDAEDFMAGLIADELRSVIDESEPGQHVGMQMLSQWLEEQPESFSLPSRKKELSKEKVEILLAKGKAGVEEVIGKGKKDRKQNRIDIADIFRPNEPHLNEKFSIMSSMRTFYADSPRRKLSLGTLVEEKVENGSLFWVCIQPRCDATRISESRAFPLLPLKERTADDQAFEIVLPECFKKVTVKKNPHCLNMVHFKPEKPGGDVIAEKVGESFVFTGENQVKYHWVGELRYDQAQRLAEECSRKLGRVGLDEYEWQRQWADRN
ncbi:MAG: response regulator receiver domain [Acidobacteriota bacterium]|nr:response regulator receiver domain [Acidobacteriota bacterium]